MIPTCHASWCIGQQRSSSNPVCHWPASGGCPGGDSCMFFIFTFTVLRQVVFSRPHFSFPSGIQWIATLVMELASLHNTCPIQRHHFRVMMVSISSCWHRAKRPWLEMVRGQKDALDFPKACRAKGRQLGKVSCSVICQHSDPYRGVHNTQLW